ncbi:GntR family transcriptional regulator [Sneathiella chinensis]|uniref:GntR family transcriptional regulator n=1 Tax=Sneathiella chinensis TaxID=349750 RepID=A0ABQ5U681_9PROT|nr:GntR family transcriptional regulator [Sneathiella chinensis]GLQ06738.1 GntR family transcriptional regulator [Sneathiella chinensis]
MTTSRASELVPVLEQEIVTGELKPGTRLDETLLAERFGVSRTPVREALTHLAAAGLVVIRPRRGAIVATISIRDLMNMFEVMANLEGVCARLAARRITPEERPALKAAFEACDALVGTDRYDDYYEGNLTLHNLIYQASHNAYLEKQTRELRRRLSPHRRLQVRIPGRLIKSSEEHGAIVRAILDGNSDLAERLTRDHVTIQGERFTDFLSTLPPHYVQASA